MNRTSQNRIRIVAVTAKVARCAAMDEGYGEEAARVVAHDAAELVRKGASQRTAISRALDTAAIWLRCQHDINGRAVA